MAAPFAGECLADTELCTADSDVGGQSDLVTLGEAALVGHCDCVGLLLPFVGGHFAVVAEPRGVDDSVVGGHCGLFDGTAVGVADCGADDDACPQDAPCVPVGGHWGLLATGAGVAVGVEGFPVGGHCALEAKGGV